MLKVAVHHSADYPAYERRTDSQTAVRPALSTYLSVVLGGGGVGVLARQTAAAALLLVYKPSAAEYIITERVAVEPLNCQLHRG